jgi:23S rRNA (pseudouridine1915-N3)-methyltransferase
MRVHLIAVGRLKSGPERELCDRYSERFQSVARSWGVQDVKLSELSESSQRRPADRQAEEARAIDAAAGPDARRILLDERGKPLSSEEFAQYLKKLREAGTASLAIVVGGPDGLDAALRTKADLVLSFGKLTIPHQIVRALVLEQLYRASTILAGHPYHRV